MNPDLSGWAGQEQTERAMSDNRKTSERDPARPSNCAEFDPDLSKAEVAKRIDALRAKTGRGR
jgi:hypothetical protein